MRNQTDVAIIGAGPGGAALAGLLAREGAGVVVLEKDLFPRFHIGESLLPLSLPVLADLGISLDDKPFALRKAGALLFSEITGQQYRISFDTTLDSALPNHAFQVERDRFDAAIAARAQELGAEIRFGCKVNHWEALEGGVALFGPFGSLRANYLVDATGQHCLLARGRRARRFVEGMGQWATFAHFKNLASAKAAELFARGDILLLLHHGIAWAWAIPLPGGRLSLGVVHRFGDKPASPETCFQQFVDSSPLLGEILEGATRDQPVRRCADFSFYNTCSFGARFTCTGDAHAFLDPVFSSGVSLALFSAQKLAHFMLPAVRCGGDLNMDEFHSELATGYRVFERIIERFYRPGWAHTTFFIEEKPPGMVRQLNSILAGDVWRSDNEWQNQLLRARRTSLRYRNEAG